MCIRDSEGVYQNYRDIFDSPITTFEVNPGDLKYKDLNNDNKIDDQDRTMIGNPTPDFTYGLNINLSYKNFDLGIDFMGVYGNEIFRMWGSLSLIHIFLRLIICGMVIWCSEALQDLFVLIRKK